MIRVLRSIVWLLARFGLALRYRVRLHGDEHLRSLRRPVLLLPNHPAYVDPVLFLVTFFGSLRPRIVFSEGNFPRPIVGPLVRLLDAIPIPDLLQQSDQARSRTAQAIRDVIAALRRGETVGLWPSGRAQRDGTERLGPASALTEILRAVPEASVVVVRTRGLWGSMFNYARTGHAPPLGRRLWQGALLLAANMVFLMPRRRVDITVEPFDRSALPPLERDKVNPWFEDRYNVEGPEPATYVPYHFLFGPRHYEFPKVGAADGPEIELDRVPGEIRQGVIDLLSSHGGRTFERVTIRSTSRLDDLGFDSLQRMDLALAVEQQFGGTASSMPETVGQLMALAQRLPADVPVLPVPSEWFRATLPARPPQVLAANIPRPSFVVLSALQGRSRWRMIFRES